MVDDKTQAKQPGGGRTGILVGVLMVLLGVVWGINKCDKSVGGTSPKNIVGASAEASSTAMSATVTDTASPSLAASGSLQESPFNVLWKTAQERTGEAKFDALFSLYLSKSDYCTTYTCGDEFSRDTVWGNARKEATTIKTGLWRTELGQEKLGLISSRDGFTLGAYDQKALSIPVQLSWPRDISGTSCSPKRTGVERSVLKGVVGAVWKNFETTITSRKFSSVEEARAFKQLEDPNRKLRLVFKITDAAVDVRKVTRDGVTADEGALPLALIKILAYQLLEDDKIVWEQISQ